jgi:pheromone shutdown protein TraB
MPTWTWKPVAWGRDKTTRILLLVVSTNIGASLGAFVVIPSHGQSAGLRQ